MNKPTPLKLIVQPTGLPIIALSLMGQRLIGLIQTLSGMHNHKTSKVEIKLTPIRLFNAV